MELTTLLVSVLAVGVALAGLMIGLFAWLRQDVRELRQEMREVRQDMGEMRQETAGLRERMSRLEGLLDGLREAVAASVRRSKE